VKELAAFESFEVSEKKESHPSSLALALRRRERATRLFVLETKQDATLGAIEAQAGRQLSFANTPRALARVKCLAERNVSQCGAQISQISLSLAAKNATSNQCGMNPGKMTQWNSFRSVTIVFQEFSVVSRYRTQKSATAAWRVN
jgi:hypothetical protein